MKSILLTLLLMSPSAFAEMPGELTFPSLQEQFQSAKVNELLTELRGNDYFAGKTVTVQAFGKTYTVDRKAEPSKVPPGVKPPQLYSVTELLEGLDASSRASIGLKVHRDYYRDGTLKSEDWIINIQGGAQVSKKGGDEPPLKTGEETED